MGGEEGPGTAEEADRGGGLLVVEGLGVGQAGEAVDGGVQVGVADPGSLASFGGFGFGGSSPVGPPASPRWDASDLLDVQVDHVAREAGQDRFADPVGLSGGAWCRLACSDWLCPAIPFPADTIFNGASHSDRYRIFFEHIVTEGNYDAVALLTAEAESAEYVEPSASLSLANLEAAIRARIAYIKALPDDVFDELTAS